MKIRQEDMDAATHDYIGTWPCGCVLALVVDIPNSGASGTRKAVSDFMRSGANVTRIHHDDFRAIKFGRRPECAAHKPKQPAQGGLFMKAGSEEKRA